MRLECWMVCGEALVWEMHSGGGDDWFEDVVIMVNIMVGCAVLVGW